MANLFLDRMFVDSCIPAVPAKYCDTALWWATLPELRGRLRSAIPFEVSNVAEYFYQGTSQEVWDLFSDFPGCLPPFERTWLEWKLPATTNSGGEIKTLEPSRVFTRVGCELLCAELGDPEYLGVQACMFAEPIHGDMLASMPVVMFKVSKTDGSLESPFGVPEGQPGRVGYRIPGVPLWDFADIQENYPDVQELCRESCSMMYPAVLAISLLNCRNVSTREVRAPRQQIRHAERHAIPMTKAYRVIEIQPVIQQTEAASGQKGYSKEAVPIIRGHFKDYSKGNGLFGSLKGRFWWHQRVSGPVSRDLHYELAKSGAPLKKEWHARR